MSNKQSIGLEWRCFVEISNLLRVALNYFCNEPERRHAEATGKERSTELSSKSDEQPKKYQKLNTGLPDTEKDPLRTQELLEIKKRYLAPDTMPKRSTRRWNDKKILFDWHPEDDTSIEHDHTSTLPILSFKRMAGDTSYLKESVDLNAHKHWSEKTLDEMQERDWRILKEDYSITTSGGRIPHPIRRWSESNLSSSILHLLERSGLREPTPIQRQAIPIALEGRDLIALAETGSGKTLAFILPIITRLLHKLEYGAAAGMGPYALVLAPTRELALQIEEETKRLAIDLRPRIRSLAIVGGHSMAEQSFQLQRGTDIVIATPGRLLDCLDQHMLSLEACDCLVLDEADRLVDLGFEPELSAILANYLPASSSRLMFSATMPATVERLARQYLQKPAVVEIGQRNNAVERIEIRVEMMSKEEEKRPRLLALLEDHRGSVIIFVNQKHRVDTLARSLGNHLPDRNIYTIHGGKSQDAREEALECLRTTPSSILIATDVASRGIDVKDLTLVINYDMAKSIDDFIHRIGRTGRAGSRGCSITFLLPDDSDLFYELRRLIERSPCSRVPPTLAAHPAAQGPRARRRRDETIYALP